VFSDLLFIGGSYFDVFLLIRETHAEVRGFITKGFPALGGSIG
jgi:hypothetical protein